MLYKEYNDVTVDYSSTTIRYDGGYTTTTTTTSSTSTSTSTSTTSTSSTSTSSTTTIQPELSNVLERPNLRITGFRFV